jgi:hypothetical protein
MLLLVPSPIIFRCLLPQSFLSILELSMSPILCRRTILKNATLTRLPAEIVDNVADFLELQDASRFSRCCKRIHRAFPLNTKDPPTLLLLPGGSEFIEEYYHQNRPGPEIPVDSNIVHTVVLETMWKDQGWGNYKGTLFIVAYDSNCSIDDRNQFSRGRVVRTSPLARHEENLLRMEFRPRSGEIYRLWMYVGSGGGHRLEFDAPLKMYAVGPRY